MSENSFEDYIRQHRPDFEEQGPRPALWEQLEAQLPARRQGRMLYLLGRHWLKAAVVLVLVVNTVMIYQYLQFKRQQQQGLGAISPELQDAKMYYTGQIEQRLEAIRAYPPGALGLDSSARKELELRNDTYQMLEAELKNNPGNERIKAAMVRYYQMKLDLLDKILDELRDKQSPVKTTENYEREI